MNTIKKTAIILLAIGGVILVIGFFPPQFVTPALYYSGVISQTELLVTLSVSLTFILAGGCLFWLSQRGIKSAEALNNGERSV